MLKPWETAVVNAGVFTPIKNCFFGVHSPVALTSASPIVYQSQATWGTVARVAAVKAGEPNMYISCFQEDAGDLVLWL